MSNQNRYAIVDRTTATPTSFGAIVTRHSNLNDAVLACRSRGPDTAIVHPSELLGGGLYNQVAEASREFFSLVETDMRGRPIHADR